MFPAEKPAQSQGEGEGEGEGLLRTINTGRVSCSAYQGQGRRLLPLACIEPEPEPEGRALSLRPEHLGLTLLSPSDLSD